MDDKIRQFIKRHIFVIWIVVVCTALSGMIAMALYTTNQNRAKKVVSLLSQSDIQFSSNYLEEETVYKTIVINDGDAIPVDIRNYSAGSSKWYSSDITYTLVAQLTDSTGNLITNDSLIGSGTVKVYEVTTTVTDGVDTENETLLFTLSDSKRSDERIQTLVHDSSHSTVKRYKIYFSSASLRVYLKLTAIPAETHNDLRRISAVLSVSDKSSVQSDGWSGYFNDDSSKAPTQYDAFNYFITGHGKSESATIKWNADVITLNRMYIKDNFDVDINSASHAEGKPDGWKQISITIDDDTNNGMYAFQVFKGTDFSKNVSSWNDLESSIEFDDGM